MRDIRAWRSKLARRLRNSWDENASLAPGIVCDIELGLTLLTSLAADLPASALWVLLSGYPFSAMDRYEWGETELQMLRVGRQLLPYYRSPYPWHQALEQYQQLDERLRGFAIGSDECASRRNVT